MGKFADRKSSDGIGKYILKFEDNKTYLLRIAKKDYIEQWKEIWPTFMVDGNRRMTRFTINDDGSNINAIHEFKKNTNLEKFFGNLDEATKKRVIGNWRPSNQNAMMAITGIEQIKVIDGTKKRVIVWDYTPKIWMFSNTMLSKIESLDRNPDNIERAEEALKGKQKVCSIDEPDDKAYYCHEVFALRITKTKNGQRTDYTVETGKCVGAVPTSKLVNFDEVQKALTDHVKPASSEEVDQFISDNGGGNYGGKEEAEFEEEVEENEAPKKSLKSESKSKPTAGTKKPEKKKAKPADEEEEDLELDEEGGEDGESEDVEGELDGIEDIELDEEE